MKFVNTVTGNFTNTPPELSPSRLAASRQLANWLAELAILGQVLPSFASKTTVRQFNKLQSQTYQLAATLDVKNVVVPAVYNPDNIQSYGEWMTKFDSIIGRQSQVFTAANSINLAGLSNRERALYYRWMSWKYNNVISQG